LALAHILVYYYVRMADDEANLVACTWLILASLVAAIAISYGRQREQKDKTCVNTYVRNRDSLVHLTYPFCRTQCPAKILLN